MQFNEMIDSNCGRRWTAAPTRHFPTWRFRNSEIRRFGYSIILSSLTAAACCASPCSTQEAALTARLPEIFARSADHYRGLMKAMEGRKSDQFPKRFENGKLVTIGPTDWCSGFFPGSLWYLYEATGAEEWKVAAKFWTDKLETIRHYNGNHDIGFMLNCSVGNGWRLAKCAGYDAILRDGAAALTTRYSEKLGLIRSWNSSGKGGGFFAPPYIVIIDNMMNLELLEWASKNGGDRRFDAIARRHADLTDRHHFRPDGSAYHVLAYNTANGKVHGMFAGQGACVEGTWARGHAWAIYGFAMMHRETGETRYLDRAVKAAEYWLTEKNLPADGVPYWDFKAAEIPNEERDASAAAIAANAFFMIADAVPCREGKTRYRQAAVKILTALASDAYFAKPGENGDFLIKHCTGNKPGRIASGKGGEVDVPLNYADYYFLEGLMRVKRGK